MTASELKAFLSRHNLSPAKFATVIGVTPGSVNHWLLGRRTPSLTVARLCRLFDRQPELMGKF